MHDTIHYITHSPKRIGEFHDHQKSAKIEVKQLLSVVSTRWLSFEAPIRRLLETWNALLLFYGGHALGEGTADKVSKEKALKIYNALNNPVTKASLYFLAHVLGITNSLNTDFQSSDTRIRRLVSSFITTYAILLQMFIRKRLILVAKSPFSIDLVPANYLELDDMKLGTNTECYLEERGSRIAEDSLKAFKVNCLRFCKQMRQRISWEDPILSDLKILDPCVALGSEEVFIICILVRFSTLLGSDATIVERKRESIDRQLQELRLSRADLGQDLVDQPSGFSKSILHLKNGIGEKKFADLSTFMLHLCCLPHTSTAAKRQFSFLSHMKTRLRNKLNTGTVSALMMTKQLVGKAASWTIPSDLLDKAIKWREAVCNKEDPCCAEPDSSHSDTE